MIVVSFGEVETRTSPTLFSNQNIRRLYTY